ncbi:MAG: hypothetical protein ING75_02270 [Rhodocyclaceae bacterium]|nr:hypothetical protein [Rhodocyclaceae bacterium]
MSEIKKYAMNLSSCQLQRGLNLLRTLAFTEVHCVSTDITAALSLE